MEPMGNGQHELGQRSDRLLWPAAVIAACAMLEVWASWLQIGSVSGFPHFGRMTTGWVLPVSTEAYWSCALFAWLAGAPGSRSRNFAMWSAAGMFILSLGGQELAHLLAAAHRAPSAWVVGFVSALPLVSLAMIALLVHFRHADQEEAEAAVRAAQQRERDAERMRQENDERTVLRARIGEMEAGREETAGVHAAELAEATGRLTEQAHAERAARLEAEAQAGRTALEVREAHAREIATLRREVSEMQSAMSARASAASARRDEDAASLRAEFTAQMGAAVSAHQREASALRDRLEAGQAALASAQREAREAAARAETLTAKLAAVRDQAKREKAAASAQAAGEPHDTDLSTELRALMELQEDPKLLKPRSGGKLADRMGIGGSTARRLLGVLVKDGALTDYALSLMEAPVERSQ
jgi:hypothetical protein